MVKGGWRIGDFDYAENPRFTTPAWATRLVARWWQMRMMAKAPMGPEGRMLPCAGGYYDQPAAVLDAFALFDRLAEERQNEQHPA